MSRSHRVIATVVSAALCFGSATVHAEDFTGFYAGVNAGYGFARDRHERDGPLASSNSTSGGDANGLPPSALSASQAPMMRGSRSERPQRR